MRRFLLLHVSLLLAIKRVTLEEVLVATVPAFSFEIYDGNFSSLEVFDFHFTDMLDIHGSENQILDLCHGTVNREVLTSTFKVDMLLADWYSFHIADGKAHLRVRLHREIVVLGSSMSG